MRYRNYMTLSYLKSTKMNFTVLIDVLKVDFILTGSVLFKIL